PNDESHEKGGNYQPDGNSQASIDHNVASLHLGSEIKNGECCIKHVRSHLKAASQDPIPTVRTVVKIRVSKSTSCFVISTSARAGRSDTPRVIEVCIGVMLEQSSRLSTEDPSEERSLRFHEDFEFTTVEEDSAAIL